MNKQEKAIHSEKHASNQRQTCKTQSLGPKGNEKGPTAAELLPLLSACICTVQSDGQAGVLSNGVLLVRGLPSGPGHLVVGHGPNPPVLI